MTTNNGLGIFLNSGAKLAATIDHVENGTPLVAPETVSDPVNEPDPELTDDLATALTKYQRQVDAFYTWATTSSKSQRRR